VSRYAILADEYRQRAHEASLAAAAATLDEVRRKHETAAAVWTELADAQEARAAERARVDAGRDSEAPGPA
jgi:hypothetical protein